MATFLMKNFLGNFSLSIEAVGFDYSGEFNEMPDYASVELEFLGHLSRLEAEAWQ